MGSASSTLSPLKKIVTLHDWWLIKPETDTDDHTKALQVAAGIASTAQHFPVYWEEFASTCPKRGEPPVSQVHEEREDSVERQDVYHDCDDDFVDPEMKDCQDTSDKTTAPHTAESPEHIVNTRDVVLYEKSPVTLEVEDDPRLVMNPMGIDGDGIKHNAVKKAVDSSKCLVVSSRRMTRSMRKMDFSENKALLSHDLFSLNGSKRKQSHQNVDVTEEDHRIKLMSQVGQEKNKEDTDNVSGDFQIHKRRSYLGVKRFKSECLESRTPSVGCQLVFASSVEDFKFASTLPNVNNDPLKANMKACQNTKKIKKEEIPAAHGSDSKKAIMTRSRSKSKVTPQREIAKRKPLITTPKSTPRAKKATKDPYGSPNIVSPEDFSGKKSRSGRVLLPTLEFWRNQKVVYDKDRRVYGIEEPM